MIEKPISSNLITLGLLTNDGREVTVRHIRPEDGKLLAAMFWHLSSETRWRRFHVPLDHIDSDRVNHEAHRLAAIDHQREVALIALAKEAQQPISVAVARFARATPDETSAEASIVVRDDYQGAGLGAQLFDLLVQVAIAQGLRHLILLTHADNLGVIHMIRRLGIPYERNFSAGLYEIDLQLSDDQHPLFPYTHPEPPPGKNERK